MGFDSWDVQSNNFLDELVPVQSSDIRTKIGDDDILILGSNNYLGLTGSDELAEAACNAARRYGTGSGAVPLVCGHLEPHRSLENKISEYKRTENALLFSSGYVTNLGVVSALMKDGGVIFSDELNHASIVDGARISGATVRSYAHCDAEDLRQKYELSDADRKLVVTDSVFSLDGDVAPLEEISDIVGDDEESILMVDEAHASGVIGEKGGGVVEKNDLHSDVDIQMGTLSKALAAQGGFVATTDEVRRFLFNNARSFMFSTGLAPATAAAAEGAINISQGERGDRLRRQLHENSSIIRDGVEDIGYNTFGSTHIVPVIVGDEDDAMMVSQMLRQEGIFSPAYRPPAVPEGTSRLRLTPTAKHDPEELKEAVEVLKDAKKKLGTV